MYETDVTVRVTTDVPIEPVGEIRRAKMFDWYWNPKLNMVVCATTDHDDSVGESLIVTPVTPKEPEVRRDALCDRVYAATGAEPGTTGNVRIGVVGHCKCGNSFSDDIQSSAARLKKHGYKEPEVSEPEKYTIPVEVTKEQYDEFSGGKVHCLFSNHTHARVALTPRITYPPELMSPDIWGIAIDEDGRLAVHFSEPGLGASQWLWKRRSCVTEWAILALFPDIKLPTLADFGGEWTKAKLKNPNWKGE